MFWIHFVYIYNIYLDRLQPCSMTMDVIAIIVIIVILHFKFRDFALYLSQQTTNRHNIATLAQHCDLAGPLMFSNILCNIPIHV